MSAPAPIRVILADDHLRIHEQVTDILNHASDVSLVAQASNGEEAVHLCQDRQPDIVLMDVVMPGMGGVEATRQIKATCPNTKILVLSSFQDDESVQTMLENGASGYVTKRDLATSLLASIRTTHLGQRVFSEEVAEHILTPDAGEATDTFGLTDRELEVLVLMAQGLNNGEIGGELFISRSTVNFHIGNIVRKLGVETRSEALVAAAKHGLV